MEQKTTAEAGAELRGELLKLERAIIQAILKPVKAVWRVVAERLKHLNSELYLEDMKTPAGKCKVEAHTAQVDLTYRLGVDVSAFDTKEEIEFFHGGKGCHCADNNLRTLLDILLESEADEGDCSCTMLVSCKLVSNTKRILIRDEIDGADVSAVPISDPSLNAIDGYKARVLMATDSGIDMTIITNERLETALMADGLKHFEAQVKGVDDQITLKNILQLGRAKVYIGDPQRYKELLVYMTSEGGVFGIKGIFGTPGPGIEQKESWWFKSVWVDQSSGIGGDDFSGTISIPITETKFLVYEFIN